MPVAAGKNTENTEKKDSPPINCGFKFSTKRVPEI